MNTNSVRQD